MGKKKGFIYLLVVCMLFMNVPIPSYVAASDTTPIVIDNIVDSIENTWVMKVVGLAEGNTGILYSTSDDDWNTIKVRYKVFSITGAVLSDISVSDMMGARATNVSGANAYAIAGGRTVITWEGTSNGCGGAFQFVIVAKDGTAIKTATDISTASAPYNCYTGMTELSNGNLAFMWQNTGDEYLYRIFNAAGNALTSPTSVEKGGTRQDSFPHNSTYTHSLSANDQGQFLITYDIYQNNNYIGAMYDDDGTRRLTNGVHHFYLAPKPSNASSYNIGLKNGHFGVFFRTNTTLSMDIINSQGQVQKTISSDLVYQDNQGGAVALKNGEFLVYDTSTQGNSTYLYTKHYSADGTLVKDWTQRDTTTVINHNLGLYYSVEPLIFAGYDSGFGFYNTATNKLNLYDVGTTGPPSISEHPSNQMIVAGQNASFTVAATNATAYQWQVNTGSGYQNITDNAMYSGAMTATLQVSNVSVSMNSYLYRVVINGTVNSNAATLTVNPLVNAATPTIMTQSSHQTILVNGARTLNVAATVADGGALSYQWYSQTTNNNSGGTAIVGATSATYTVPTNVVGTTYYYVIITNTNNSVNGTQTATTTSNAVRVIVHDPPTFTVSETGTWAFTPLTVGYTTSQRDALKRSVTLTKVGIGAIENLAVSFSGGVNSSFMTGTVQPDTLDDGVESAVMQVFPKVGLPAGTYTETVTITADGGLSESFQVSITINPLVNAATPVIQIQPVSEIVYKGDYVVLSVGATISDNGQLHYQWFRNTGNNTLSGIPIDGANDATYEVPTDTEGTSYYYVAVININNSVNGNKNASEYSNVAEIKVNPLIEHTVTFNLNGGSMIDPTTVVIIDGQKVNKPADPMKVGHTFAGWYKDSGLNTEWNFDTDIVLEDMTLYAKWEANPHIVTFETNGGTTVDTAIVLYGEIMSKPLNPVKEGYTFVGWYKEVTLDTEWNFATDVVTEDMILYAKWSTNPYTVTFNTNGGTTINTETVQYGDQIQQPTDPTKVGHTFVGWYKDSGLNIEWDFATDVVTEPTILYAKWQANSYTIAFDTNGGTAITTETVNYGNKMNPPTPPTKAEHTFVGWYKDSTLNSEWDFATDIVTENTTLYAKWAVNSYKVTFNTNGGTAINTEIVHYGDKLKQPANPTKAEHTFVGWYKDSGLNLPWNFVLDTVAEDMILYAKWAVNPPPTGGEGTTGPSTPEVPTPTKIKIAFDIGGGTILDTIEITYNTTIRDLPLPKKEGFEFLGWYQDQELTKKWSDETRVIANMTLYAKWEEIKQPVTPQPSVPFNDVEQHWAKEMITELTAQGIIKGYEDGSFRPNEPINRQHVAALVARAFTLKQIRTSENFSDVSLENPYYEAIMMLQQAGIVDGENGLFNPKESITRAQVAKILVSVLQLTPEGTSSFKDVSSKHWSAGYIAALERAGITLGDNGYFYPNSPITRAQLVAFLYRALHY
ncbi:InlB B-repeat-containing protein [Lysinibacillus louembei]|uniref:InlB B-repeat-containing protein n=1 Tax=Lysinibacillus louembei TaxID=1470088 RepID=A0ABZ0S256_9BACI|nr:InlB B-repeat-containing protein [Lysinibacillus louembei]WPK13591.1 InlB B-repeat-containing protein [Lysinibacillus louembei]